MLTALLTSGLAASAFVVLLLLARRMAGALVQPLGGLSLVAIAGLGLLLAGGWRLGWQARGRQESSLALVAPALPGIALFLFLCGLSLPGTASWALMLTWLAFLTGEAAWWWAAYSSLKPQVARISVSPRVFAEPIAENIVETGDGSLPNDAFQQITRYREGEQERVAIMLRISFVAGQRIAVAHVAFCPPLSGIPELAAEVTEGSSATVTITNPQSFGARMEVRLEEAADEACVVVVEAEGR
ncbi:MAG: hypothetical protein IAF94_11350 [Pirellulaceae bacterium]|nr:hypothetical protein [Pirellulaceae bacterium]